MSDLRSACIEAMAEAMPNRCAFVEDVTPAFDALLGVLEEHADDWLAAEAASMVQHESRLTIKGVASLLAVLREDT